MRDSDCDEYGWDLTTHAKIDEKLILTHAA